MSDGADPGEMSDGDDAAPGFPDNSPRARSSRIPTRIARWGGELLTVFAGVYAAFVLNDYQTHRQERQRREQILAWMDGYFEEALASASVQNDVLRKNVAEFDRAVAAGEMPALHPFTWRTDYDPSDVASLLGGGGGFDLLEVETVREIRETESDVRSMLSVLRHDQQLSDVYILPNLENDHRMFYNPATGRLRPQYQWYAKDLKAVLESYGSLVADLQKLLTHLREERGRDR